MTAIPTAPDLPAQGSMMVAVHARVRVLDRGRVLLGGSPFRLVRLTDAGARAVAGWCRPAHVGQRPERRRLARTLLDAGMLTPHAHGGPPSSAVTVVVPVRDRSEQLARCLDAVRATCPASPVIVVDDGSADSDAVRVASHRRNADVVAHRVVRGPAAARNTGLMASATELVAFIDSDVVVPASWIEPLLGHLGDPCVGAVAPRVAALGGGRGVVAGYEKRHSALDMGSSGGLVAPGRPISYVPSTVLLVRRRAAGAGFDASLPIGEDVDFVWRLAAAGWRVVYEPKSRVLHDHPERLLAFAARRRLYARSVASLAQRHPEALPAIRLSPWMATPWALALLGYPRAAAIAVAVEALMLGRRLRPFSEPPHALAAAVVARGLFHTGLAIARAVRRAWAPPLACVAAKRPASRRLLLAALAVALVEDALETRRRRVVIGDVLMRLLDEAIAVAGMWEGCVRGRTVRPLLPTWRMTVGRRQDGGMSTARSARSA